MRQMCHVPKRPAVWVLGLLTLLCAGTGAAAKSAKIKLSGVKMLPRAEVRAAIGPLPERPHYQWCEAALQRVLSLYRRKGYSYARGWVSRTDEGRGPVSIEVDEGKISRIAFTGAGSVRLLMLQVEIYLPGSIFHKPTLDAAMARIIKKYSLSNAYYRVRELSPVAVPFGRMVPKRMLHVYIVGRERFGWGLDISLNSTWGLVPAVSLAHQGLLFNDDRAAVEVGVGFPYRKFLFEEEPEFQWVHGFLYGSYRPTRLASKLLEPFIEFSTTASRYRRTDIDLAAFKQFHADVLLDLRFRPVPVFAATLGLGYDSVEVFDREMVEGFDGAPPDAPPIKSFAARLNLHFEPTRRALRQDLRTFLDAGVRSAIADAEQWVVKGSYRAQLVVGLFANNLILSSQGMMYAGTTHFWDQEPLSSYLRVFFDNRYWIEEVMQVTAELRLALFSDVVKLGVFHQGVLFTDLTRGRFHAELANAFGPGVHLLVFDNFAVDVYYGFGFSPAGFDHNYYLNAAKVF